LDTIAGATDFKSASSTNRTRSVFEMAPPLGIAPSSHRLTGGPHTLCVERNVVLPTGFSPASSRLEDGCLIRSATGALMKWSRTSVLPRVSPDPKSGGFAVSLVRVLKNGGLCGHCSRDLPLDRRLLFVAELTGHEMVGCVGNAPTLVRLDIRFTGGSRSLRGYQPEDGCGTWSRTTIEKLMRLLWFSTFPPRWRLGIGRLAGRASRFEMVDRHGFAPCSPACEASDLLNDRAAQEIGGGGGNRTRSLTAYEAAAFPPGSPAI
jgi:hypothetical protein